MAAQYTWVHYLPILTTLISAWFASELIGHYRRKPKPYIAWWLFGVVAYGAGTLVESLWTLLGPSPALLKWWYVLGALLGGAPLAQGTAFLLLRQRVALALGLLLAAVLVTGTVCVFLSPVLEPLPLASPSGKFLAWTWVRMFSPFINTYAFVLLVGGAVYSAIQYAGQADGRSRYLGNIWIAVGGLLPGIGGMSARAGHTEVLYVAELLGLLLIYMGYRTIAGARSQSVHMAQQ